MKFFLIAAIYIIWNLGLLCAQEKTPASTIFLHEEPVNISLTFDQKKFIKDKNKDEYQLAQFQCYLEDSTLLESEIKLKARGFFRRNHCAFPPIKLKFEDCDHADLRKWDEIKMVTLCRKGPAYEQYVLAEYVCYKIFNVLTDNSFRVRLAKVTYNDSEGKKKTETNWGFLIEDIDVLAERLGGEELEDVQVHTERTERDQMTLVSVFEYFLGNTDWSVPANHNIKLVKLNDPSIPLPIAIPYDFDYSGFVSTTYAVPNDNLPIDNVRERLYRGYCRTEEEYQSVFNLFNEKREDIYEVINGFEYLDKRNKKRMNKYMDDFYQIINNPGSVKWEIMQHCRT